MQVGLFRTSVMVETDEGVRCGLAATLVNPGEDHHYHPAVHNAGHLQEMSSAELVGLVESHSFTEVSIGLAAINALLPLNPLSWVEQKAEDYLMERSVGKNVAVIGHFPFVDPLRQHVKNLWVLELNPREGDLPASAEPEILPQADFIAITATTLINQTFEDLIPLCRPDATVMLLGPSTPLSPLLYDAGVKVISGTVVTDPLAVTTAIGQGVSLHTLKQAGLIQYVTMIKE